MNELPEEVKDVLGIGGMAKSGWVSQDEDGYWYRYTAKPEPDADGIWVLRTIAGNSISYLARTEPNSDWKETLRELK